MNEAINAIGHLSIIIGLSAAVVILILVCRKDFKEDYNAWKGDKNK